MPGSHTWHAVDVKTGRRGPQLTVQQRGTFGRIIGAVTDVTMGVSVQTLDPVTKTAIPFPEWRSWTQPGRMMAVCCDPDDRPIWGGIVLRRIPDETTWVPIYAATLEHYFDRRYSGTLTFAGVDQSQIGRSLVQATITSGGIPFVLDTPNTGILRDRTYYDSDDKTTLSLLTDLLNLQDGIEFTVDLDWADFPRNTMLRRTLRIRPRIGTPASATRLATRFEYPGSVTSFKVTEDYTKDYGANDVMATSSGEGGDPAVTSRPQSAHMVGIAAGEVRYERRFTPSTSITNTLTLDNYARAELAAVKGGLTQFTFDTNLDTGPRLNADWYLGDDISAAITAPAYPERITADNSRLPGYERTVRAVGWTVDLDQRKLTPMLRELVA